MKLKKNKGIREFVPLSQKDLSEYLQTHKSSFSLAENGRRALPAKASLKQSLLYEKILRKKIIPANGRKLLIEIDQTVKTKLEKQQARRRTDCLYFAAKLNRSLLTMETEYNKWVHWFFTLPLLRESNAGCRGDMLWLDIQENKIKAKLLETGPANQQILRDKISLFEAELKILGKSSKKESGKAIKKEQP
ncbi:MAG: hypothetical protein JWQ27_1161 [Ferruginibacter sp.]|nr:hypothetical protein [Ferruginibacter sp.]